MPITQTREIAAAKRLDNVRYAIRDLACVADEVIRQGHKVLPLNVGDPLNFDFQTPPHIIEAAYKAMRDGKNGYAPSPGIPEALEAIRGEAARKGITTLRDAFVTSGVSETVDLCISALVNPGEDILTPKPDYPLYSAVLCKLGIPLNAYDLNEDDAWQPELADIERKLTPRTRAIVLINPNNPTGSLCSREMLEQIADLARRHSLVVFSDEIYDKLILDFDSQGNPTSAHRLRRGRARRTLHYLRRHVEKLSRPGMAHRMGHRLRRRRSHQALHRRHSSPIARAPLRQPSRAIRHQARARRPAGSPHRSAAQTALPPRPHAEVVRIHAAHKLRRPARRLLRLPAH